MIHYQRSNLQLTRSKQLMFMRVARNYERMNRLMTFGQDRVWRKEVVRRAGLRAGMDVLDLGTGTGDLTRLVLDSAPGIRAAAADLTLEMMLTGYKVRVLPFLAADAADLPFEAARFDAVISGWLMRNVADLDAVLREQFRVLKLGGRIVILDTTRPRRNLLTPFIRLHMRVMIPLLGRLISGNREAYEYLKESSEHFLTAEELADRMKRAGFIDVGFKRRMAGTIAIHWGSKPATMNGE
jgi:demethylmenaquinone methyltransferase / 2-methoxy-6-polyprenyl-1,4-benzoquinol methylase